MLFIKRNIVNKAVFRLTMLSLDLSAVYEFQIYDINNELVKTFTAPNTSDNRFRYDRFDIELVDSINDEDLSNGKLFLLENQYTYRAIYDGKILETDILKIEFDENI